MEASAGAGLTRSKVIEKAEFLRTSRPTAVNLSNALDQLLELIARASDDSISSVVVSYAETMIAEDSKTNLSLSAHGLAALRSYYGPSKKNFSLAQHCNTGNLAVSGGGGTALGVVRKVEEGV